MCISTKFLFESKRLASCIRDRDAYDQQNEIVGIILDNMKEKTESVAGQNAGRNDWMIVQLSIKE
jgi:hypothetical protein